MSIATQAELLTKVWRAEAARLRDKYKGMTEIANAATAAAHALELCAEGIEGLFQPPPPPPASPSPTNPT